MKSVLLIFPGNIENQPRLPFSILVLASHLRKKNIPVEVLDTRVQPYNNVNYDKYMLIGVSAKTGEQLSSAVKLCKYIKSKSKTPIVWGGPHATFFPEQTCKSELVDFVVRSEGEETLYELVKAIQEKKEFEKIKGLTFKRDGKVISNEDREFIDMNKLEIPAYDLVNFSDYIDSVKYLTIETSRGCPHRCSFCYVHQFHKRKWRFKSVQKVISEIKEIRKKYGANSFFIADDNFFVIKSRVIELCNEIVKNQLNIKIFAQARADYFANYSEEELNLIAKSGFEFLSIGAESGSQRVLDMINKDIKVEDIFNSAKKCINHKIRPVYSFVIGIPGERLNDLNVTLDAYQKLRKISKNVEVSGLNIFTPYPGTPLYEEAIKNGYKPYKTLEGWADWKFSDLSNITWLTKKSKNNLQTLAKLSLFICIRDRLNSYGKKFKRKKIGTLQRNILWYLGSPILSLDAAIRLKLRFFSLGYEWLLFGKIVSEMNG
ncbi:MAG: radical SAM protein [archaeon]